MSQMSEDTLVIDPDKLKKIINRMLSNYKTSRKKNYNKDLEKEVIKKNRHDIDVKYSFVEGSHSLANFYKEEKLSERLLNKKGKEILEDILNNDYKSFMIQNIENEILNHFDREILENVFTFNDFEFLINTVTDSNETRFDSLIKEDRSFSRNFKSMEKSFLNYTTEEIFKSVKLIDKFIKKINQIGSMVVYDSTLESIINIYHVGLKKFIENKDFDNLKKLYKSYESLNKKYSLDEGRDMDVLSHLLHREKEYSNFKRLSNVEDTNLAMLLIFTYKSDKEIEEVLSKESVKIHVGGQHFNQEYNKYIDFEGLSDIKKKFMKFYMLKSHSDIKHTVKTLDDLLSLYNFERNVIKGENSHSFYDSLIKNDMDFIKKLINLEKEDKTFLFKSKNLKTLKNIYSKETSTWQGNSLSNIYFDINLFTERELKKKFKGFLNGWFNYNAKSFIDEWLSKAKEQNFNIEDWNKILFDNCEKHKEISVYVLESDIFKDLDTKQQNKIINTIEKKYKEDNTIKSLIKGYGEIDLDTDYKKAFVKKLYQGMSDLSKMPEVYNKGFEMLDNVLKDETDKYRIEIVLKSFKECIYDKNNDSYNTDYKFDDKFFQNWINLYNSDNLDDKIKYVKKIYKRIDEIKDAGGINDKFNFTELEKIIQMMYPDIKHIKWLSNKISLNKWNNRKKTADHFDYNAKEKTIFEKAFIKSDFKFFETMIPYIKKLPDSYNLSFDLNDKMIDNFLKYKDSSKEEKLEFIKEFEIKYKRDMYASDKDFDKMFSWILLNNRLPQDYKLYNSIDEVSNFNLSEYSKFKKDMDNIYKRMDKRAIQSFFSYVDIEIKTGLEKDFLETIGVKDIKSLSEEENKEMEKFIIEKYIHSQIDLMDIYGKYGIFSAKIINKVLKDDRFDLIKRSWTLSSSRGSIMSKESTAKSFDFNYSKFIDMKQLNNNLNLIGYIENIENIPFLKDKSLDVLKLLANVVENTEQYTIIEFKKFMYKAADGNKDIADSLIINFLDINKGLRRRNLIDFEGLVEIFGNEVFNLPKEQLLNNSINKMIEKEILSDESKILFEKYDVKHDSDYIIKSILVQVDTEIRTNNYKSFNKLFKNKIEILDNSIMKLENQEKLEVLKNIESLKETLNLEIEKYVEKHIELDIELDLDDVNNLDIKELISEMDLLKERREELISNKDETINIEEFEWSIEDIRFELDLLKGKKDLCDIRDSIKSENERIKTLDYGTGEIREFSQNEKIKVLYQVAKNNYTFEAKVIKLLLENNIKISEYKGISQGYIPEVIKVGYDKLVIQRDNLEFTNFQQKDNNMSNLDIQRSLLLTYKNQENKIHFLKDLKMENQDSNLEILDGNDLELYHANRQEGMLNCMSLSDVGESALWHIMKESDTNGLLVIKDNETGKNIFSSYVLQEGNEFIIDNIEGSKDFKLQGLEMYRDFIKEIVKKELIEYKETGVLKIEKVTMSNQYSKIQAVELNSESKVIDKEDMVKIPEGTYSDAKESRIELFNIKDFIDKNPKITKSVIDSISFKTGEVFEKEKDFVLSKINNIIKSVEGKSING